MKRNRYSILCILVLLAMCGELMAQDVRAKVNNYFQLLNSYPQEKLYLHLDKPYYAAGEHIYWKGYLINATSHVPHTKTNFIYVELVNRDEEIISKYKVRREEGSFHGSIALPPDILAGEYRLRAYTQWMINAGEDYFYSHQLRIGNALDRSILSTIRYEDSDKEGDCTVVVRFTDERMKPLSDIQVVSWLTISRKKAERFSRRTNAQGEISFTIPVEEKQNRARAIEVAFKDDVYTYDKTFYIPLMGDGKKEFALTFFPEGGDLLEGCRQRVAFKAQQADGHSCAIHGFVTTESGDTVSSFRTEHDGMGIFMFVPSTGQKYLVKASRDSIFYRHFPLPEVKQTGCQLTVIQRKGIVQYNVLTASQTQWQDTLYLVGHTRGALSLFVPLTATHASGRFKDTALAEGITELLLVDKQGAVLSRRLIFVSPEELINVTAEPLPRLSDRRKKIEWPLRVTDKQGAPVEGVFSVSLTDRNLVVPDSLTDHIRSYFLLTSDIKGYIENPAYYFQKKTLRVEYNTDLLLLTHGWSRFRHDNIAELPTIHIDHFMEGGQFISGKATKLFGGKATDCPVLLLAPTQGISATTRTDADGNFLFTGIEYKDTVTFLAQARSKSGLSTVFLKVDSLPQLPPHNKFPPLAEVPQKYQDYDNTTRNAYLSDGGMQVIRLNEVTVTARRKEEKSFNSLYGGMADYRVTGENLRRLGGSTGYDLLMRLPGVRIMENNITLTGQQRPPLFIISEMRYEDGSDVMRGIDANDIEGIEILKGASASFLGMEASGGVIIVSLKMGADIKKEASPGLVVFTSQGYSQSAEFYHPVYETPEQIETPKTDIRSTVYWNPDLKTDADGKATIRFYTPDNLIKPHLIMEGVTAGGYLLRVEVEDE